MSKRFEDLLEESCNPNQVIEKSDDNIGFPLFVRFTDGYRIRFKGVLEYGTTGDGGHLFYVITSEGETTTFPQRNVTLLTRDTTLFN